MSVPVRVIAFIAVILVLQAEETPPVQYAFMSNPPAMCYTSPELRLCAEAPLGFVSLQLRGAEFLAHGSTWCGFAFRHGARLVTRFPDLVSISHESTLGRAGTTTDGCYQVRLTPHRQRPEVEIYAGFNEAADHDLLIFLGDEVVLVREATGEDRPNSRHYATPTQGGFTTQHGIVVVHRGGAALSLAAPCTVARVADPDGQPRLVLSFPCKGLTGNVVRLNLEPVPNAENFLLRPQFAVTSSDDGHFRDEGPSYTAGVGYPVYGPETKVDFGIQFQWLGEQPFTGYAELDIVHALGQRHCYERVPLDRPASNADNRYRAQFHPRFTLPGVSEVWGRLLAADGRALWVGRFRMLYDWPAYRPRTTAPPDLRAFWDDTLAQLRAIPLEATTERVTAFADHPSFEISTVTFAGWGGQRLHAMLFVPKDAPRPLPALVTAHPNITGFDIAKRADGTYGAELKHDPRFITIVPLIRGHAPDAPHIPFNHPWWGPLDSRDKYAARRWYCAMVRAVDYLATRPELVDMKRIVARGGSQGGGLALVTAALDRRVALCLADSPANCQLHEILQYYPSFGPSQGQVPVGQTLPDLVRTLSYYDPANLAPWIRCPTHIGLQVGDTTVHSMGGLAVYHQLTGLAPEQKGFYPGPNHAHACSARGKMQFAAAMDRLATTPQP